MIEGIVGIIFAVYLIGGVLSYGRCYADLNERGFAVFMFIMSWVGLLIGIGLKDNDTPFLQYRSNLPPTRQLKKPIIGTAEKQRDFFTNPPEPYSWK